MKHIIVLAIIGLVLSSGYAATGAFENHPVSLCEQRSVSFSPPILKADTDFTSIQLPGTNGYVTNPGLPLLPSYRIQFTLPFGSRVQSISIDYITPSLYPLIRPIQCASIPIPVNNVDSNAHDALENDPDCYPEDSFQACTGAGLNGRDEATFLSITCYPCRYYSKQQVLSVSANIDITITYQAPSMPIIFDDEKDLLIIAPEQFSDELQPLITHKESKGMRTILKTVEDLLATYQGYDAPEQIKYAIKDFKETLGIRYVLLVGGLNSPIKATPRDDTSQGTKDWYVPVRYSNLNVSEYIWDPGFISDLYYADLYDSEGNFSSWDPNGNHIYAEWQGLKKEIIDLYPDIYIGRLACANQNEVKTVVDKIINYESSPPSAKPWFSTMIAIGGDTFKDNETPQYYEGEEQTAKALSYMTNFTPVKVWASNKDTQGFTPTPKDILSILSNGAGFVYFSGHGNPAWWNTYWTTTNDRAPGLHWYHIPLLKNQEKLPVIMMGACHNSLFNVTATSFLHHDLWAKGPVPQCFSWLLVRYPRGGAIATLGNTGLGFGMTGNQGDLDGDGIDDPDCVEFREGYLESLFYKGYGVNGIHVLGDAWGYAISHYLDTYLGWAPYQVADVQTIEQWVILGDPSLMIGGY